MIKYFTLLVLALALNVNAQEGPKGPPKGERPPKHKLTESQKKLQTELLQKYDVDKNGKLDREEREKVSQEDRKKLREAGLGRGPNGPRPPRKNGPPPKKD